MNENKENSENTKSKNSDDTVSDESNLHSLIDEQLTKIGSGGSWVWKLFFFCVTPNILNGFHVSSYVFLGQLPNEYWCVIPDIVQSNWTSAQMRTISSKNGDLGDGCRILNWDYQHLSTMTYNDALVYTLSQERPPDISCRNLPGTYFHYEQEPGASIVPEWDLICEKSFWRTSVAVAVSFGKFIGATTFGILSDKFGRKTSFTIGAALYIFGSVATTFSPWYILFLFGRVALGSSSSGLFYPAFALLTENIGITHRSWMSIAFSMSYPIGMIWLAIAAFFIHPWRYLQFSLTIPAFLLIGYAYFMIESPRWLLSKGRYKEAYKIVFKKKKDIEYQIKENLDHKKSDSDNDEKTSLCGKLKKSFAELSQLYGNPSIRRMALICHFTWCVTALSYYVTALNADNLSANRVVYVAVTGCVDMCSYILSIVLLRFVGRKLSACGLFALSGIALLLLIAIPRGDTSFVVMCAMFGRFGISAVYSIVTLHTAELFPTKIRNSALGTCSTMSHVGSIAAPYVVDFLGNMAWFIPTTICGIAVVIAGLMTLTLPETKTKVLTDHVK